jgi:PqqD family protein of HPr-rel-A system
LLDTSHLRDLAISDGGFVFDPLTGHTYNVNDTGLAILRALKEGETPDAIADRLREQFDVDRDEDLARDVEELISRLREHGLVR